MNLWCPVCGRWSPACLDSRAHGAAWVVAPAPRVQTTTGHTIWVLFCIFILAPMLLGALALAIALVYGMLT